VSDSDTEAALEVLNAGFRELVPHNKALGFCLVEAGFEPPYVVAKLPFDERLVGHPDSGLLHGGAITSLLDAAGGAAVYMKLNAPTPIATLDLRIDYLKPAAGRVDVLARAECVKVTKHVAFARMIAFHDDPDDPVALGSATYMIGTRGEPVVGPGALRCRSTSGWPGPARPATGTRSSLPSPTRGSSGSASRSATAGSWGA
jgi:uncharacterized protein (TIGR00369 family)